MEAPDQASLLIEAVRRLAAAGVDTPNLDASLLLCRVLGCTRTDLIAHPNRTLASVQVQEFEALVTRREAREPLPHLIGEWEFMGHAYEVGPQALIPRPETEILVEAVVERLRCEASVRFQGSAHERGLTPQPPSLPGKGEPDNAAGGDSDPPSPGGRGAGGEARVPHQILDIGTGTGCIPIELALRLPEAKVTSIDLSPDALELATKNVTRFELQTRVALRHARFPDQARDLGPFDAVVSNPPYIPSAEVDHLAPELIRYEPRPALDGGPDGLDVIRALVTESQCLLKAGGLLAIEIGHDQATPVRGLLQDAGWVEVEIVPDLAGIERVVLARWPG
jgi:release factor glutamine methyltransferase